MTCPVCGEPTRVVDSRPRCDSAIRRRKCTACDYIFATEEIESKSAREEWRRYLAESRAKRRRSKRATK